MAGKWWRGQEAELRRRRQVLAASALFAAPGDYEHQSEVAEEAARLLALYNTNLVPVMVLLNTVVLGPEQMANFYVQPWPWMPVVTSLVDAVQQRVASKHTRQAQPP